MRAVLVSILALLVFATGIVPAFGGNSAPAKGRNACCDVSRGTSHCGGAGKPMPCCTIRPAPAPTADVPPSSPRAETLTQVYLHFSPQILTAFQASNPAAIHPHDLSARSDSLRLYQLHSAYLI